MLSVDVVVVGGGPAGASAATVLALGGRSVLLVDKARFPRDKCCGDGLTAGALRNLEFLGLDPATVPSWQWVDDVSLSTPYTTVRPFPLPTERGHFAAVATRLDLDAAVLDRARAAGAEVWEETTLTALRQDDAHVVAAFARSDGQIVDVGADYLIAADGMWSTTRKLLGPSSARPYLGEWHGYRQYASNVHTERSRQLWIWFEPDLLPGYLWSFPLANGRVNLGFGILREESRPTKEMKSLWPDLLARPHVRAVLGPNMELEDSPKAWPIPAAIGDAALTNGRVLYVGDAARACDVLTGEGIGQALHTGITAAGAILGTPPTPHPEGSDGAGGADGSEGADGADVAQRYETAIRASLTPDHTMSTMLGRLIANKWVCEAAIRFSGSTSWTSRNFARWLFEDYARGIALTPTKWRWGLMSGPGAFENLRPTGGGPQRFARSRRL